MARIYTMGGEAAERDLTVAHLINAKGTRRRTQATATTADEAQAAVAAGIDMLSVSAGAELALVRAAAPRLFLNCALPMTAYASADELMRGAMEAMEAGADAVYYCGPTAWIAHLAQAGIPVMGHAGLVPRKSIWIGGLRAYGKTPEEAVKLWDHISRLEDAGAYAVEIEVVPAALTAEITRATSLLTSSIGAGTEADIIFQFTEDTLGMDPNPPRHVKPYDDFAAKMEALQEARIAALQAWREDVNAGSYPAEAQSVATPPEALDALRNAIGKTSS